MSAMPMLFRAVAVLPGFCSDIVSVTFCMKIRPFSCSFGFPSFVTSDLVDILFFGLLTLISLQQRRIISKRYILYCGGG
jgi:hypothetical protein